jgi:hypothetical protein
MLNKTITIPSIICFKPFNTLFQILILTMYQLQKFKKKKLNPWHLKTHMDVMKFWWKL